MILDPGPRADLLQCCELALQIRAWFRRWKLRSFAKVSGSKALQVYLPLNTRSSYSATQPLARRVAEDLARANPGNVIAEMARAERTGKVFIDWSQNAEHKTTVSVYSLRAKHEEPLVSMPLTWKEIEQVLAEKDPGALVFSPLGAIQRVRRLGDIFAPVLTLKQAMPRRLADELRLPAEPAPEPVKAREPSERALTLPRSSGQGGRPLFVVHRRNSLFELGIEHRDKYRLYNFPKIPARKSRQVQGTVFRATRPLTYLIDESPQTGTVWDLGTYEIYEGSLDRGRCTLTFSGQRMNGAWILIRDGDNSSLVNMGGQIDGKLPAIKSTLPRFTTSAARMRRHAR